MYLSVPLRIVKMIGIDTNLIVNVVPYIAHCPIVILTDYFTWKVAKRVVGKDGASLTMIFYFFNRFFTMHIIRTLTNSIETMFTVVAFYFYLN